MNGIAKGSLQKLVPQVNIAGMGSGWLSKKDGFDRSSSSGTKAIQETKVTCSLSEVITTGQSLLERKEVCPGKLSPFVGDAGQQESRKRSGPESEGCPCRLRVAEASDGGKRSGNTVAVAHRPPVSH